MNIGHCDRSPRERFARAPMIGAVLVAAAILFPVDAGAHAVLDSRTAIAGGYQKLSIRIGHGCKASPTVAVEIQIPEGIIGAKPQPKPGWQVSVVREPLAVPFRDGHGTMVTERIARIVWTGGPLEDWQFDEFAFHVRLPNRPGETLTFPVVQRCSEGEHRWVEEPAPGQLRERLREPAPVLFLLPRS